MDQHVGNPDELDAVAVTVNPNDPADFSSQVERVCGSRDERARPWSAGTKGNTLTEPRASGEGSSTQDVQLKHTHVSDIKLPPLDTSWKGDSSSDSNSSNVGLPSLDSTTEDKSNVLETHPLSDSPEDISKSNVTASPLSDSHKENWISNATRSPPSASRRDNAFSKYISSAPGAAPFAKARALIKQGSVVLAANAHRGLELLRVRFSKARGHPWFSGRP